jgi:hypothetical protein
MLKKVFFIALIFTSLMFAQDNSRFIEVNGTSEVIAPADYVHFNVNIRNVAKTLEQSRQDNLNASNELEDILKKFNISKDDWEMSPIKFGKEYIFENQERKLSGYFSQVNVSINLKNMNDYYPFTKELSKNKVFEITNSNYGVSDILKYHKEATIKAVQAAKEKAEYIAQSIGMKTGKVIQISELNQFESYPNPFNSITTAGGSPEDISGKISIKRSVNMKIELAY